MKCADLSCECVEHLSPATHIPVCPIHAAPLVAADAPGLGKCMAVERRPKASGHIGGQRFEETGCTVWGPQSWVWRHRSQFHGDDLPPHNGWQPVDLTAVLGDQS